LKAYSKDMLGDEAESIMDAEEQDIADGGAATSAYSRLQFESLDSNNRALINDALLRYCELDTLAMVMIVEAWRDFAGINGAFHPSAVRCTQCACNSMRTC
jgi:predicted nucleotidyltransferase